MVILHVCLLLLAVGSSLGCHLLLPPPAVLNDQRPWDFPYPFTHSPKIWQTFERCKEELYRLPGVTSVAVSGWTIQVYTANPATVPPEVEGVLVDALPAWGNTGAERTTVEAGSPHAAQPPAREEVGGALKRHGEGLVRLPGVRRVWPGREGVITVSTDNPAVLPATVEGVPVRAEPAASQGYLTTGMVWLDRTQTYTPHVGTKQRSCELTQRESVLRRWQ